MQVVERCARITALHAEIAQLEREQDADLIALIAAVVQGRAFAATELFDHQAVSLELREAFQAAGIRSAQVLGKHLQRLQATTTTAWRLERVGVDYQGVIWTMKVCEDFHAGPCLSPAVGA